MKRVIVVYFSPTHTTQKVVREIACGMAISEVVEVDMTLNQCGKVRISDGDIVVVGGPVYKSRLPQVASERLQLIEGSGQPVVCVAVYGNNTYGDTIIELADMMVKSGLEPVACAGFIGEHSYANEHWRIANGRPNVEDLQIARSFGQQIMDKLEGPDALKTGIANLNLPGKVPTEPALCMPPMATETTEGCTGCNICVEVCPVGAIDENLICDGVSCIKCFACIKSCPEHARILVSPIIEAFSEKLSKMSVKIPELFL